MAFADEGQWGGWDLPAEFELPSVRDIELELALASDCWQSLLRPDGRDLNPAWQTVCPSRPGKSTGPKATGGGMSK